MKRTFLLFVLGAFGVFGTALATGYTLGGCSKVKDENSSKAVSNPHKTSHRKTRDTKSLKNTATASHGTQDSRPSDATSATNTSTGKAPLPKIGPITVTASSKDIKKAAMSINKFTGNIWQAINSDPKLDGKNAFASPWSMVMALGMTYGGARKETAAEMAKIMQFNLPQSKLHAAHGAMISSLSGTKKQKKYDLVVANSIWPHKDFDIKPPFVTLLKKSYGIGIRRLDYENSPPKNAQIINGWVKHWTHGMVKNLLRPDNLPKLTRLVLVNTIFFKGDWVKAFNPKNTTPQAFHLANGKKVLVPTMAKTDRFELLSTNSYRTLRMHYKGNRIAMEVILPKKKGTIKAVEASLASQGFQKYQGNFSWKKLEVSFPKFKIEKRIKLKETLEKMGMKRAFDMKLADFTGITSPKKEGFFIGQVIHKAVCEVNETGTKAAAATAVVMTLGSAAPTRPEVFRVDRPFLMVIRDKKTNVVLFVGRVMNPNAK